jgi:two-component system, chemotaxis family, sensor kinase CheA
MIDDLLLDFVAETKENLAAVDVQLVRLEAVPDDADVLANIFRLVHTIKGSSGFVGLPRLGNVAHAAENILGSVRDGQLIATPALVTVILSTLDRIRSIVAHIEEHGMEPMASDDDLIEALTAIAENKTPDFVSPFTGSVTAVAPEPKSEIVPEIHGAFVSPNQTVRVPIKVLDHLMDMVSELVLTRNQLVQIVANSPDNSFEGPVQRLSQCTTQLQEGLMRTRLQPIAQAWSQLPRIVRDLAFDLGKRVSLHLSGEETGLDRQVMELIKDPLIHMVRNAVDHGIEMPSERVRNNKPESGQIHLQASQEGGSIFIRMRDDGRGLQTDKLLKKAIITGAISQESASTLTPAQIQKLIFLAGMTTTDKATTVSGRGVGMDVVKSNIERIGGTIDISSIEGFGCEFTIKIPLTLAIISALLVQVGDERFAFPQSAALELLRIASDSDYQIEHVHNAKTVKWRDELVTLADLRETLDLKESHKKNNDEAFVILTRIDQRTIGIIVDEVVDTQEIVVKPLPPITNRENLYSGAAILGDGKTIIILSPEGIAEKARLGSTKDYAHSTSEATVSVSQENETQMLIANVGKDKMIAIPLGAVTRIDEIDCARIEWANGKPVMQFGDAVVSLVIANSEIDIHQGGTLPVILFTYNSIVFGLIVTAIIDIFSGKCEVQPAQIGTGVIGTAVINGRVTDILDLAYYFARVFSTAQAKALGQSQNPVAKPTILVIDESPFFRTLMRPLLQSAGYEIVVAASVTEAQSISALHPPFDVILSDIDGLDAAQITELATFRESAAVTPSRLVALSLSENGLARLAGHRGQFDDWAIKMDSISVLDTLTRQVQAGSRRAA